MMSGISVKKPKKQAAWHSNQTLQQKKKKKKEKKEKKEKTK